MLTRKGYAQINTGYLSALLQSKVKQLAEQLAANFYATKR